MSDGLGVDRHIRPTEVLAPCSPHRFMLYASFFALEYREVALNLVGFLYCFGLLKHDYRDSFWVWIWIRNPHGLNVYSPQEAKCNVSDGQNSLLKICFYFKNRKYYFILYFQNTFEKYFVEVFEKYFRKVFFLIFSKYFEERFGQFQWLMTTAPETFLHLLQLDHLS